MLTDGFVPLNQVARLLPEDRDTPVEDLVHQLIRRLCAHGLWEECEKSGIPGFMIHDYHDYQPSRETVLKDRQETTSRVKRWRERNGVGNGVGNMIVTPLVTPPPFPIPLVVEEDRARAKQRPIFQGQRFVVFQWQDDNLTAVLGSELDAFQLGDWYRALDTSVAGNGATDTDWPWLRKQLLREIRKRGLTLDSENAIREREKQRPRTMPRFDFNCQHVTPCRNRNECAIASQLNRPLKGNGAV